MPERAQACASLQPSLPLVWLLLYNQRANLHTQPDPNKSCWSSSLCWMEGGTSSKNSWASEGRNTKHWAATGKKTNEQNWKSLKGAGSGASLVKKSTGHHQGPCSKQRTRNILPECVNYNDPWKPMKKDCARQSEWVMRIGRDLNRCSLKFSNPILRHCSVQHSNIYIKHSPRIISLFCINRLEITN